MNRRSDELGEMLEVISSATKYLRQFPGQVLDTGDPLNRGRVKVMVPELGWLTSDESPWMEPEYPGRGALTPDVADWVVVYFIAGDCSRPVYRSRLGMMKDSTPDAYLGPNVKVIFQDGDVKLYYDTDSGEFVVTGPAKLRLEGTAVEINGSSKAFVTYAELNTALGIFLTALNLHVHPTAVPGPPSPPVPMTLDISAAQTTTVKTGG